MIVWDILGWMLVIILGITICLPIFIGLLCVIFGIIYVLYSEIQLRFIKDK